MSLGSKQREFTWCIAKLIQYAYDNDYELTFGDSYRDPRVHGEFGEEVGYSHPKSVHKLRLAVDFNLFKDGQFLTRTEDHKFLGEYWESLHPDARWGGRFDDGNHYSFEYWGVK